MKKLIPALLIGLCLTGCNTNRPDDMKIIVAASSVPHAEILRNIKEDVEAQGYEFEIREVSDYVTPNMMLESEDIDANYFQHTPYLEDYNKNNGTELVAAFKVHFEPMGIYSHKVSGFAWSSYPEGSSKIIIPNDTSNKERAMKLLNDNIGEYLSNYEIIEAEAQSIPILMNEPNVVYACVNGNYALSAGITDKCLITEPSDSETAQTNANVVAVKVRYKNFKFVKVLKECLLSEKTKTFIESTYGSAVKAVF